MKLNHQKTTQLFLIALALTVGEAGAVTPNLLTYQGRLQESGVLVTGNRDVNIALCSALTPGGACNADASCTPSGTAGAQGVAVSNGLFRSTFTVPVGVDLAAGPWYMEVRVGATGTGGTTCLAPREQLSASAYALYAASATTLAGPPLGPGVTISTSIFVTGSATISSNLTVSSANVTGQFFSVGGSAFVVSGGAAGVGAIPPAGTLFQVGGGTLAVTSTGHIEFKGGAPTSACGTGVIGNDMAFTLTGGGALTSPCTITFANAWTNAPICQANDTTVGGVYVRATPTTTTVVIAGAYGVSDNINILCLGWR